MASTNKTANLGLSQWAAMDAFTREDLNADLRKLDSAFSLGLKLEKLQEAEVKEAGIRNMTVELGELDYSKYFMIIIAFRTFKYGNVYISSDHTYGGKIGESRPNEIILCFTLKDPNRVPVTIYTSNRTVASSALSSICRDITGFMFTCANSETFDVGNKLEIWGVKE